MITEYYYNSQDQVIDYTHKGSGNFKRFRNIYDYAGRLYHVDHFYEPGEEDNPEYYLNLLEYNYNENSQTDELKMNAEFINTYSYNNRNWITSLECEKDLFYYSNNYFKNGNVKSQVFSGGYNDNFTVTTDLAFTYKYDRSNRLTETKSPDKTYDLYNTYDKDGNILTMQRNGSTGNSIDDFNYSYYSGTNKLSKVTGSVNQYTYDANGNMTKDDLNKNFDIIYDYRNLIIQLKQMIIDIHGSRNDTTIYHTFYYYDEAGNRIRKMTYDTEDDSLKSNIIYSRDISGRELAIYENRNIKQFNIWGIDNAGFINANGDKRYYLKDHLGSIRAVIDDGGSLISAQDYDAWGYQLQGRSYNSEEVIYKFTSKERDIENKYDYFGARYYDARVGRWGQVEPKNENNYNWSSFVYCIDNPLRVIDPLGLDWFYNDKNNEWEYIEDASFMINVNYDLESQITTTSIIQGEKEFLGFNGSALTWYEPRGLVRMWNARSGVLDNEDRTQPELQNESSRGPIPEGWYSIDPNTAHYYPYEIGKGKLWKINPDKGTLRDWGQGWTPLNPTRGNSTLKKKDLSEITFKDGIVIGFAQALALIPGSSRNGVTITAGLFRGLKRDVAARYSFLLSIPAIALSGLYELYKERDVLLDENLLSLSIATVVSGIVGYLSIAFLISYLKTRSNLIFIIYRIALGILILILLSQGILQNLE